MKKIIFITLFLLTGHFILAIPRQPHNESGNSCDRHLQAVSDVFSPDNNWKDIDGNYINAHGGCVLYHQGLYYWYGENRPEKGFVTDGGISCYSSEDLHDWKRLVIVLKVSDTPGNDIEWGCIMERPKVIYNERTGKFVMWFHLELKGRKYEAARSGVAISDSPEGPFVFLRSGRINPNCLPENFSTKEKDMNPESFGNPDSCKAVWNKDWVKAVKKGLYLRRDLPGGQMARDMTLFKDEDGKAYHIYASEENLTLQIAELTEDYTGHTGKYIRLFPTGHNEAPVVFRHGGKYWMITSGCTGWEPNEARMFSAPSIWGPWKQLEHPFIGKDSDKTFGGQGTYAFKRQDNGQYVFMLDVWRPSSLKYSGYIWIPISFGRNGIPVISSPDGL